MVKFLSTMRNNISGIFRHLFLYTSVNDILVRISTLRHINEEVMPTYNALRFEILQDVINTLEHMSHDEYVTEQLFSILTSIVRKCYQMAEARVYFDELMGPFNI